LTFIFNEKNWLKKLGAMTSFFWFFLKFGYTGPSKKIAQGEIFLGCRKSQQTFFG
jgi:hypothetical protein